MGLEIILLKLFGKTFGKALFSLLSNKYFWIALAVGIIFFMGYTLANKNNEIENLSTRVAELEKLLEEGDDQLLDERTVCAAYINEKEEIETKYADAKESIRLRRHCPSVQPTIVEACPDASGVLRSTADGRPIEEVVNEISIHGDDSYVRNILCELSLAEESICEPADTRTVPN